MLEKRHKVSLIFNANKAYDRGIICGIGEYLQSSQCDWDIYIEEDFSSANRDIFIEMYDGIIADFDDPHVESILSMTKNIVVGVGGSYNQENDYPKVPYVATDNFKLVESAFIHLRDKGIEHFVFYGFPEGKLWRWSKERQLAFREIIKREGVEGSVYSGYEPFQKNWDHIANGLKDWLKNLYKPTGIIVATDARARHLLQVCEHIGIMVPEQIAVIGIDNEELTRYLSRIPLSSVEQGTRRMGYEAAKMLHHLLLKENSYPTRILVPPVRVHARQSTDYKSLKNPYVIQAIHYIRLNACKGIKVEDVLEYVGVSRTNLESKFSVEIGHTIHQEIFNVKLQKAKSLLKETSFDVKEISYACGYPSPQYMYAIFKKELNVTPIEFRCATSDGADASV